MSDEQEQAPENDFAKFEASTKAPEPVVEAKPGDKPDDTLELGSEDAPEATPEQIEAEKTEKKRSRPWSHRVDILTARLREAEKEAAELRERATPSSSPAGEKAPESTDKNEDGTDKYEFGEADPAFLRDAARFDARQEYRAERAREAEEGKKLHAQNEVIGNIQKGMVALEKAGTEKYDDFEAKIEAAVEARGGEPLPPLLSIGIAVSPAGADIAYHLASDESAASKIEALAQTNPQAAAIAFGELEGRYLDNEDDADLNPADPLDMARMLGRERARRKGLSKAANVARKVTSAPEPPEQRARGANGQFAGRSDTQNFAEFEAMANKTATARR